MGRLLVALGEGVGVSPSSFAAAWDDDEEAHSMGSATVDTPVQGMFLADVLALVVIPLLVNVGSSTVYDLVRQLVAKSRPPQPGQPDLELVEVESNNGDRIIVVRVRGTHS